MRVLLVLLFAGVVQCRLAPLLRVTPNIPGQYIVALEDDINVGDFATGLKVGTVRKTLTGILNAVILKLDGDLLDKVRSLKGVKFIEEDGLATVLDNRSASGYWGLDRIDQRGNSGDGRININGKGTGTNVYILDTGIRYSHVEFGGRAKQFFDYENGDGSDCHSHGTHCAATAGGKNSGVATGTNLYSVRVMACSGSGAYSDIIAGLNAVTSDTGRSNRIASMSLGGGFSQTLNNAVKSADAAGVLVVAAAGNSNVNACNDSPASSEYAITVGATTVTDKRWAASNWGSCLNIFAPGADVKSAGYQYNSEYITKSGTSQACPHVAGVAAVHLSNGVQKSSILQRLISDSTKNVVSGAGSGSPNRLLYVD